MTPRSVALWWKSGADISVAVGIMPTSRLRRSTMFPLHAKLPRSTIPSHSPFRGRCLSEGRDWLSVTAGFLMWLGKRMCWTGEPPWTSA